MSEHPLLKPALALRAQELPYSRIALKLHTTQRSICGLLWRYDNPEKARARSRRRPGRTRAKGDPFHNLVDHAPSKAPFAPDNTVPDFAWDDDHCSAVLAIGGYPALRFGRTA